MTFSVGLANVDVNPVDVSGMNLYLSDDEVLTTKSSPFAESGTYPITIGGSADGATATTGLIASVSADTAQCSSYSYLCVQVSPDDSIQCFDISSNIDCKGRRKNNKGTFI